MVFKIENPLKTNIRYGLIGIGVGLILNLGVLIFGRGSLTLKDFLSNTLFSAFITLSIANIVALFLYQYRPNLNGFWKFIPIFYLCNAIGMVIGIELSYLITSIAFSLPFQPFSQLQNYRVCSVLVLVVGTLILLYHMHKVNNDLVVSSDADNGTDGTRGEVSNVVPVLLKQDFYEVLNFISDMVRKDPLIAEELSAKMSRFLTAINENQSVAFHTIAEELELIDLYCVLKGYDQAAGLDVKLKVPEELLGRIIPRFFLLALLLDSVNVKRVGEWMTYSFTLEIKSLEGRLKVTFNRFEDTPAIDSMVLKNRKRMFQVLNYLYRGDYAIQEDHAENKLETISIPLI